MEQHIQILKDLVELGFQKLLNEHTIFVPYSHV